MFSRTSTVRASLACPRKRPITRLQPSPLTASPNPPRTIFLSARKSRAKGSEWRQRREPHSRIQSTGATVRKRVVLARLALGAVAAADRKSVVEGKRGGRGGG